MGLVDAPQSSRRRLAGSQASTSGVVAAVARVIWSSRYVFLGAALQRVWPPVVALITVGTDAVPRCSWLGHWHWWGYSGHRVDTPAPLGISAARKEASASATASRHTTIPQRTITTYTAYSLSQSGWGLTIRCLEGRCLLFLCSQA